MGPAVRGKDRVEIRENCTNSQNNTITNIKRACTAWVSPRNFGKEGYIINIKGFCTKKSKKIIQFLEDEAFLQYFCSRLTDAQSTPKKITKN
jgi:hypothetical protein